MGLGADLHFSEKKTQIILDRVSKKQELGPYSLEIMSRELPTSLAGRHACQTAHHLPRNAFPAHSFPLSQLVPPRWQLGLAKAKEAESGHSEASAACSARLRVRVPV